MKRLTSVLLVLALLLSMIPSTVLADEVAEKDALIVDGEIAALPDSQIKEEASDSTLKNNNGILDEEITSTEPVSIENEGFPEYAIILPQGTEYTFSEDEKTIFFPALDQKIARGDTFVLYIGSFPAAYIAKNVSVKKGGVIVDVEKAPEEVYANVNLNAVLDVQDAIVITDDAAGVSSAVAGDTIVITHSASDVTQEKKHTGKLSVTLSNFHIEQPTEGRPTLSIDYEFTLQGEFNKKEEIELGQIRFLGIGTFDISFLMEVTAELELSKTGKFKFLLDSDPEEDAFIIEDDHPVVSKANGSCELKLGLKMAVGMDFFAAEAEIFTVTGGVAGKLTACQEPVDEVMHSHTDFEYYWFFSFGLLDCKAGGEFPGDIERFCVHGCPAPARNPKFNFDMAVDSGTLFAVNKDTVEALLEGLSRMLSGSKTIDKYTELDRSCAIEAGSKLTIAENQTMVVKGNMEQRGVIELEPGACLIVHGDFLQAAGTLTLDEDSHLIVDGDYTIKNDPKTLLSGGEIKFEFPMESESAEEDSADQKPSLDMEKCVEVSAAISLATKLKLNPGAIVSVYGNLRQEGGDIEGGSYTKKCKIIVGDEGSEANGNYTQTAGSLKLDDAFDVLIHGDYSVSGGDVYLSYNINGPGAHFEVRGNYAQSGNSEADFYCDMTVHGNFALTGSAKVTHGNYILTIGGDFFQSEESVFDESKLATLQFRNGRKHIVKFETPENSCLGTIICEKPATDKLDVQHGIPEFDLGSDIEVVGDLRIVKGASYSLCACFQGNTLTVNGSLIQDGGDLGSITGNGESVQIKVNGDYVIADGLLWANGGNINVGGDFRMQGYNAAANEVNCSEPSIGGFRAEDITMSVGGSVEVYCKIQNGNQGFCFWGPIEDAKLSIKGDLIQRNNEESDPYYNPFELGGDWELVFSGEEQPQKIDFETKPEVSGYGKLPVVISQNPAGLIWGNNTEELQALLQKDDITFAPDCPSNNGGHNFVDGKCEYCDQPEQIKGDLNGDREVSDQDAVYLLWHALFPEEYPIDIDVDYNRDETVSEEDAVYFLWHTLFPSLFPLN